ncbi:hypothetical protein EJB05_04671, partial [Eragrostis curvula]
MTGDHTGIGRRGARISPDGACAAAGAASCARQILPSSSRRARSAPAASYLTLSPHPGHYPLGLSAVLNLTSLVVVLPPLARQRRRSPLPQLASFSALSFSLLLLPPISRSLDRRLLVTSFATPQLLVIPAQFTDAGMRSCRAMNILNQPINPGGHPVFPAAKESGLHADARQLMPASVRFDGPSTAAAGRSPRWQAHTLPRASSYVGAEHDGAAAAVPAAGPAPPFKPLTLDFLRSFLDRHGCVSSSSSSVAEAEDSAAPPASPPMTPPPQVLALRVVVTSAVELDARQTELIARKMRRITGFVNLKVENVVDPSLIAGFVVCYGTDDSHVIDLSVKGKLAALKNRVDSIDQSAHAHESPHQLI